MITNDLEELDSTTLSAIVRANIKVCSANNNLCADTCPFYVMHAAQLSVLRKCNVFPSELKESFRDLAGEIPPRLRDQACLDMFGVAAKHVESHKVTQSKAVTTQDAKSGEKETSSVGAPKPEDSDEDEFELVNATESTADASADSDSSDDEDVSDAALGIDDDPNKPLDINDPVIKNHSWKRYQDEAPAAYAITDVYGIRLPKIPFNGEVQRLVYKKVQVFPCTDSVRELLNIDSKLGYGTVCGSGEAIEIHRWKKTAAYIKKHGK